MSHGDAGNNAGRPEPVNGDHHERVDFAERRKPLWYALRQAYRPRLVTIQPSAESADSELQVVVVNDTHLDSSM